MKKFTFLSFCDVRRKLEETKHLPKASYPLALWGNSVEEYLQIIRSKIDAVSIELFANDDEEKLKDIVTREKRLRGMANTLLQKYPYLREWFLINHTNTH